MNNSPVLIYTEKISIRKTYVFDTVFNSFIGLKYEVTQNTDDFYSYRGQKIAYSNKRFENEISFFDSYYLNQTSHKPNEHIITFFENLKKQNINDIALDFDIFSVIFYILSRAEEYDSEITDIHKRFISKNSNFLQSKLIDKPVVDIIVEKFKQKLKSTYPALLFNSENFSPVLTFDIDIAYEYKCKPILRHIGAYFKDIINRDFSRMKERTSVLLGSKKDPYDVYDYLESIAKERVYKMIFFFLVKSFGKYDRAILANKKGFKELVKRISEFAEIGIHSSYSGGQRHNSMYKEKNILENIIQKPIFKSRHHFLRLILPQTYIELSKAGITEDYSLGYADTLGYRAGTTKPFKFFDAKSNEVLPLKVFPLAYMDGTLNEHLKLTKSESVEKIKEIIENYRKHNGCFISLWHNDALSDKGIWKNWRSEVFEKTLAK